MFKKLFCCLKRFIVAVLLIYAYNKMTLPMDMFIPMNLFTILLVTFLGIPSILMLIVFSIFCV